MGTASACGIVSHRETRSDLILTKIPFKLATLGDERQAVRK